MRHQVIVICGATASGKTALAVECAKKLNSEVISADSMLIYKRCDIGTAKPTKEERQGILHHMIDVAEPDETFSVGDYEEQALPILQDLIKRGVAPVICGGTGFYINALLYQSGFGGTPKNAETRLKYERILEENGPLFLHSLLREHDPESADKLHPNDTKRVIRALEIWDVTGKKKSEQRDTLTPRFDFAAYMYDYPRAQLYERINRRVDTMIQNGLIEEVVALMKSGITDKNQCMQGIGYKEVYHGLQSGTPLPEIAERIKQNTRNYAKRQLTFFKKMQNLTYLDVQPPEQTAERILNE